MTPEGRVFLEGDDGHPRAKRPKLCFENENEVVENVNSSSVTVTKSSKSVQPIFHWLQRSRLLGLRTLHAASSESSLYLPGGY